MSNIQKYHCWILVFWILLSGSGNAVGQNLDDTLHLPEFELKSSFVMDNMGFKKVRIDSGIFIPNLKSDLSTLLSDHSTIFIKSYGNGTLATPSFRGTSAQHTQVEWNGISLNSPMLGQMDFSQVPVSQFDALEILFGAAGISRTSGAFGGVIDLVTNPDWNNRFRATIAQSIASFGNFITNLDVSAGSGSFQSLTKLNFITARNDFPFTNNTGAIVRQRHAEYQQFGASQEVFWKVKNRHLFSARLWYHQKDQNLPPTVFNYDSENIEVFSDKSIRAVVEYKLVESKYNLQVRSALNDQAMEYSNPQLALHSVHHASSWINRVRFSWLKIRNLSIKTGVDLTYDRVRSDDYSTMETRLTSTLFGEISYNLNKKFLTSLVLREDLIDGTLVPLIASFGLEFRPLSKQNLALNLNASRNYRYPTLNDLYWIEVGNPNLKPELNYSVEAGTTFNFETGNRNLYLEANLAGYYSWLFDMITWTPVEGNSALFKPENIDEIHARGIEAGLNMTFRLTGFYVAWKNNYHFCRSTYEKANSTYDNKIGKQQIYIPENTFNSTLKVERWKFYLIYNFSFTGARYTGKDNLSMMPAFSLSNVNLGRNFNFRQFILSLQVDVNNLFNLDYQSVASRPMPGINYAVTLKLGFSGQNNR